MPNHDGMQTQRGAPPSLRVQVQELSVEQSGPV
jgi:hypothetical protein